MLLKLLTECELKEMGNGKVRARIQSVFIWIRLLKIFRTRIRPLEIHKIGSVFWKIFRIRIRPLENIQDSDPSLKIHDSDPSLEKYSGFGSIIGKYTGFGSFHTKTGRQQSGSNVMFKF